MITELKNIFFIIIIALFIFFISKHYFSDNYKKKSYRSFSSIEHKIKKYSKNIPLLNNDTINIIEYNESNINKDKKKYEFWKLLETNE